MVNLFEIVVVWNQKVKEDLKAFKCTFLGTKVKNDSQLVVLRAVAEGKQGGGGTVSP